MQCGEMFRAAYPIDRHSSLRRKSEVLFPFFDSLWNS